MGKIKNLKIFKRIEKEKRIITTHELGKYILENKAFSTPIYTKHRCYYKHAKRIKF